MVTKAVGLEAQRQLVKKWRDDLANCYRTVIRTRRLALERNHWRMTEGGTGQTSGDDGDDDNDDSSSPFNTYIIGI